MKTHTFVLHQHKPLLHTFSCGPSLRIPFNKSLFKPNFALLAYLKLSSFLLSSSILPKKPLIHGSRRMKEKNPHLRSRLTCLIIEDATIFQILQKSALKTRLRWMYLALLPLETTFLPRERFVPQLVLMLSVLAKRC